MEDFSAAGQTFDCDPRGAEQRRPRGSSRVSTHESTYRPGEALKESHHFLFAVVLAEQARIEQQ